MRISDLTCMVHELSGYKVSSQLKFIKLFTTKRVGLGMTGYCSAVG